MAVASHPLAMERDLRLDFFRGLALFCIFLDHLPNNILAAFTLQSVMFADAAEVFILISGYTAGMVYGRALERQGFLAAGVRVYHRVWQLYVAHIFLFMVFLAVVAYTEGTLNKSLYSEEFGATNFLNEPGLALVQALILQFQPAFMDILPLYIVLLAVLPVVLSRVPILAGGDMLGLVRAVAGGAVRQSNRAVGVSRPGSGMVLKSVRLAGALSCWAHGLAGATFVVGFPGSAVAGCSGWPQRSHWRGS